MPHLILICIRPVSPKGPIGIPGRSPVGPVSSLQKRRSDRSGSQQGPTCNRSDRSESFIGPTISRSVRSRGVDRARTDRIHTLVVAFLFIAPSFSRPNSMFNSISVTVVFLQLFEPRHHFLSIGYHSSSSMSPQFRNCLSSSSPAPCGVLSLLFRLRPRYSFCFSVSFPVQPRLSQRHCLFLSQHLFLCFRCPGVVAVQPTSLFLVASVYSTVVLLSALSILLPRLRSDFLCVVRNCGFGDDRSILL